MTIISWNINGLRATMKKGFLKFLKEKKPDVLGLQEIKIDEVAIKKENFVFPKYKIYYNSAERPGYSGTAILIREGIKVLSIKNGFGEKIFDSEGRVQILELDEVYIINIYFPNSNRELSRLSYKRGFNKYIKENVAKLKKKKSVIVMGDFNVAHEEIDLARPKENIGNPGFTYEEREDMDNFLNGDLLDSFRYFYPKEIKYSWWSYRTFARQKNIGWRLDYLLVDSKFVGKIKKSFILDKVMGSDHAPVGVEFLN
jgi:exodeoxyribonuclease-3